MRALHVVVVGCLAAGLAMTLQAEQGRRRQRSERQRKAAPAARVRAAGARLEQRLRRAAG